MTTASKDLIKIVHQYLADPETGWSVAVFGALAEFHLAANIARNITLTPTGGTVISNDGAMSLSLTEDVNFCPYEILPKRRDYWLQGANFCLPKSNAEETPRTKLTELGPDSEAIRPGDSGDILFDLGLGLPTLKAMIRTADPNMIDTLRNYTGESVLHGERGQKIYALLVKASPHRVFQSRLGRIEVFTIIPEGEQASPAGAHSHILPDLLAANRTHSANVYVPEDFQPCFQMFPPNPVLTEKGAERPTLNRARFEAFQSLMNTHGAAHLVQLKTAARAAVFKDNELPDPASLTRAERTAIRIALRPCAYDDPDMFLLEKWQSVFERDPDI